MALGSKKTDIIGREDRGDMMIPELQTTLQSVDARLITPGAADHVSDVTFHQAHRRIHLKIFFF